MVGFAVCCAGVADYVVVLHQHSQHMVQQIRVSSDSYGIVDMLTPAGKEVSQHHRQADMAWSTVVKYVSKYNRRHAIMCT